MIQPVGQNPYQNLQTGKTQAPPPVDNAETFSLDHALSDQDREGVIYEPSGGEKDEVKTSGGQAKGQTASGGGNAASRAWESAPGRAEAAEGADLTAILAKVRDFFTKLASEAKRIFGNIWESKPLSEEAPGAGGEASGAGREADDTDREAGVADRPGFPDRAQPENMQASAIEKDPYPLPWEAQKTSQTDGSGAASPSSSTEQARDEAIKAALQAGDEAAFQRLISDYGRRTPARNTSILTQYDARGKLVTPDPSDLNRMIHGERTGSGRFG